ncbi:MAG: CpsD/CapB family tyrosine-protein kinase [Pseudomonadota bacterium]
MWFSRKNKKDSLSRYLKPKWSGISAIENYNSNTADITLDFKLFEKNGFLSPDTLSSNLAGNYSLVKRRLFRQLEYFSKSGTTRFNPPQDAAKTTTPVVLVTSASPNEGKTFSSANLTLSLALDERMKVLLIDADLANPSMPGVFGYDEDKPGLFECLVNGQRNVDEYVLSVSPLPIKILPAGQALKSPLQLLSSDLMAELLGLLTANQRKYEIIVIDGPPMLVSTEAAALAPLADEVVIVVGTGDTRLDDISMSLDLIGGEDHVSFLMNRAYFTESKISNYPYGSTT